MNNNGMDEQTTSPAGASGSQQTCGCGPGGCKPAPSSKAVKRIKLAVVVLVVAAAAGLVIRSVSKNTSSQADRSSSNEGASGSALTGPDAMETQRVLNEDGSGAQPLSEAAEVPPGTISSAAELDSLLSGSECSFVLVSGEADLTAQNISNRLTEILLQLEEQGKAAEAFTLTPKAAGYSQWIQRQAVESFPSVVVFSWGRSSVVVSDDLSKSRLLRAYLQATRATPDCGGAGENSDEPCDCGK